jgi:Antitoxin VbhA
MIRYARMPFVHFLSNYARMQFERKCMNVIVSKRPEAKISVEEMERRREALRRADAHNRIQGLFPSAATTAIYEEFIRGDIELSEIWPRVQALQLRR